MRDVAAFREAQRLRADYTAGRIEADEFEARLDALLSVAPSALDAFEEGPDDVPRPWPLGYPS